MVTDGDTEDGDDDDDDDDTPVSVTSGMIYCYHISLRN
jgi:hypothetical protein